MGKIWVCWISFHVTEAIDLINKVYCCDEKTLGMLSGHAVYDKYIHRQKLHLLLFLNKCNVILKCFIRFSEVTSRSRRFHYGNI